ncbi:MAG TPA: AEC family transporter [bacterium]|nr:AEC family transporter [bacterium]
MNSQLIGAIPPSVQQSFILFILVAAGFLAGKMGVLRGETVRSLSRFIIDFTLPAVILISMQRPFSPDLRDQALRILAISAILYTISFPLAYAAASLYRNTNEAERGVHRFAMCFSNVGFMGFPVAEALLGRESLFIVAIYNIPFQILAFSVGVLMIARPSQNAASGRSRLVSTVMALRSPAIVSAVLGFVLFLGSIRIPDPFFTALDMLGGTTTPLAMVLIGAILAQTRLGHVLANPRVWMTTLYRLVLHPLGLLVLARAIGLSGLELAVPVLVAAMPVAANTTILAGAYGGDEVTASGLVFISTTISLVTIPLLVRLFI